MINRALIRIKVIQLLYSYLLTQQIFLLEDQPAHPTKEKRFAHNLYLDLLALIVTLASGLDVHAAQKPMVHNRFINALMRNDKIKSRINKARIEGSPIFSPAVTDALLSQIKESALYKNYLKTASPTAADDIKIWRDIFTIFIKPSPILAGIYPTLTDYSPRGVERAEETTLQTFRNFSTSHLGLDDALKTLAHSMDKARQLYFMLLALAPEITDLSTQNIEAARHKYITTEADLNPNLRFVQNRYVAYLRLVPAYTAGIETYKVNWLADHRDLLSQLLQDIRNTDLYATYMQEPSTTFEQDCQFWRNVYKQILLPNPALQEALEDLSVFWNDDIDTIGTFVLKTIRNIHDQMPEPILNMYKDDEDARFGAELFTLTVDNKDKYLQLLQSHLNPRAWDTDRLAFMDTVITRTALAEILNFPKIPVSVSVNEYLDIAKAYSTPKSAQFINGLLGAAIAAMRHDGTIVKP